MKPETEPDNEVELISMLVSIDEDDPSGPKPWKITWLAYVNGHPWYYRTAVNQFPDGEFINFVKGAAMRYFERLEEDRSPL